jgi:magnesium transporter
MDPPLTPTPNLVAAPARPQRFSSSSPSSPSKGDQRTDYPLPTDKKAGNGPMGGPQQDHGPATPSGLRSGTPAPDNGPAGKPSKSSKRKKNRNRKRRNRQESFLTPAPEEAHDISGTVSGTGGARESMEDDRPTSKDNQSYFTLRRKLSSTSIESDALLDHR